MGRGETPRVATGNSQPRPQWHSPARLCQVLGSWLLGHKGVRLGGGGASGWRESGGKRGACSLAAETKCVKSPAEGHLSPVPVGTLPCRRAARLHSRFPRSGSAWLLGGPDRTVSPALFSGSPGCRGPTATAWRSRRRGGPAPRPVPGPLTPRALLVRALPLPSPWDGNHGTKAPVSWVGARAVRACRDAQLPCSSVPLGEGDGDS